MRLISWRSGVFQQMLDEALQQHFDFAPIAFSRAFDFRREIFPIERQVSRFASCAAQRLGLRQGPGKEVALVKRVARLFGLWAAHLPRLLVFAQRA